MKRIILISILVVLLCLVWLPRPAECAEKQLKATWKQVLPEPNDLLGWQLWYSDNQTEWTLYDNIIFEEEKTEYQSNFAFTSPDGVKKTWYFKMCALDTFLNMSEWSNTAEIEIDFEAPQAPIEFTLTIEIVGQ